MTSFDQLDFEPIAKFIFEQFLVLRPLVPVEGLFRSGHVYFIVAPHATETTEDGKELLSWFDSKLRPVAHPIELRSRRPDDSVELITRSRQDIAHGHGVVRTWLALNRDVSLALPDSFPLAGIHNSERTAIVRVDRQLNRDEEHALALVFDRLGTSVPFRVEVAAASHAELPPPITDRTKLGSSHDLALVPARQLPLGTAREVRRLVQVDDEFWRTNGIPYLAGSDSTLDPRPSSWSTEHSCLVTTTFPPANIRSYLTLYSSVIVAAPIAEGLEDTFKAFGVKQHELLELSRRGVVRWLLPQAIDRYSDRWLAELAEAAPDSLLFSRRLALLAARDQQARNPLYQLPAAAYERRAVLRALYRLADALPIHASPFIATLARALSEHWACAEYMLQMRGAMASLAGPLARHATELGKSMFKRDLFLELGTAAQGVEWAGALGAHFVPEEVDGYSAAGVVQLLVALSSGGDRQPISTRGPRELTLAKEILAFDNDTNVLDFVSDLGRVDLARIGAMIGTISTGTEDEIHEKLRHWNSQVRRYERRPDRLRSFGIAGVVLAAASHLSPNEAIRTVVPLMAPLLSGLLTLLHEELAKDSHVVGHLVDWMHGPLARTTSNAVLISRVRKRIASMKDRP